MTPIWWSISLAAIGILGVWLAGRKSAWGWAVGLAAQVLWFAYALVTHQYGFIASAVAYGVVYGLNWRRWVRERTIPQTTQPGFHGTANPERDGNHPRPKREQR